VAREVAEDRCMTTPNEAHPRPQLRRERWASLDGAWRFTYDDERRYAGPHDVTEWPRTIQVPFAPECPASGIGDPGFHRICWYEREFTARRVAGERLLLHFGAVDYAAEVWINDALVGSHTGGSTPFTFDVTDALAADGGQRVTVRVVDDPQDLAKPRGKQDWQLEPHSIWYPRTTGIWRGVWLEPVGETYLRRLRWTPLLERWEIGMEAFVVGRAAEGAVLRLELSVDGRVLVADSYTVVSGEVHRRLALSDPGIDDFRNEVLWSPEAPTLIHAEISLWHGDVCLDRVASYTALRSASIQHGDFMLNGRPYYPRLVLDQGYWVDTHLTPPSVDALRRDVEMVKAMGFNGVRLHQKIEDPRFLYFADTLGLLVWEEMPSAYRFTHEAVERIVREWTEVLDRDYSHPCIVVWVPFNESWGVPDLANKPAHRSCVQALYHLTKTLDATRPVVGNDGWESTATDIIGIHDYDNVPERLRERYGAQTPVAEIIARRSPAGRMITVEGYAPANQPIMLTEFGGIAYAGPGRSLPRKAWGYAVARTPGELSERYQELLAVVHDLRVLRGFCYTQLTDVFQEANGLLYADRTPKVPLEDIARATRGGRDDGFEVPLLEAPARSVLM
jgi:beta-galactosidase/beta-glucuronidase